MMPTWILPNSPRAIGSIVQGESLSSAARKRHVLCQEHWRSGNSKTLDHMVVSESLDGKIEKVDEVNEYLTSPRKSLRCQRSCEERVEAMQLTMTMMTGKTGTSNKM